MKDKKFFKGYPNFMDNLLASGYAKRSDASLNTTPYHRVYHPSKPGILCVVFKCSAGFQGKSIDEELLSCPDLTIQMIGVLTIFR